MIWVGRGLKIISFLSGAGTAPTIPGWSKLALDTFQVWGGHGFSGNCIPGPPYPHREELFPVFHQNRPPSAFCLQTQLLESWYFPCVSQTSCFCLLLPSQPAAKTVSKMGWENLGLQGFPEIFTLISLFFFLFFSAGLDHPVPEPPDPCTIPFFLFIFVFWPPFTEPKIPFSQQSFLPCPCFSNPEFGCTPGICTQKIKSNRETEAGLGISWESAAGNPQHGLGFGSSMILTHLEHPWRSVPAQSLTLPFPWIHFLLNFRFKNSFILSSFFCCCSSVGSQDFAWLWSLHALNPSQVPFPPLEQNLGISCSREDAS